MSNVNPQHWQQVKEVFEAALEQPSNQRSAFIEHACADNRALRQEVESLLKSHESAGSFMEAPAVASAAESLVGEQNKLLVGQRLKHYEILALIGEGGMGEVYLAKDTILGRHVALKLLPEYISNDTDRLRRFKLEARTASALSHPNVCVIHEITETEEGRPFIAMEYVEGITLRQRMKEKAMKLGDALDIAIQVADALTAAHEAGIIHRDIKPENVMIRRDGYIKVLDFGLAKLTEQRQPEANTTMSTLLADSSPGTVMGTVGYMSPEQARGVKVDERTDIWSLGVVLYEMVSGHPPFAGATPTDVVVAIVEKDQPTLSKYIADVPLELERIVRKALRKTTNERYQIVREMAIDLRSLRKDLERDSLLDRSTASAVVGGAKTVSADGYLGASTGREQIIDTNQLETSRLTTIAKPLTRGGDWRRQLGVLAVAAVIIAGSAFGIYRVFKKSDAASPVRFQRINVTKLTTNGNALFATISPDGKYVAYISSEGGKESLWLRQVGIAGNLEIVPPREGSYYGVGFSPDGNFIYYGYAVAGENTSAEIYKLPVLGKGASAVKVDPGESPGSLSHDGKRIAFLRHNRAIATDSIVVANADGSDAQVVASRKWPERFTWDWSTAPAWINGDQTLALPLINQDANGFYVSIYELSLANRAEKLVPVSTQRFEEPLYVTLLTDGSGILMSGKTQGGSFSQVWFFGRDGSARALTSDLSDYQNVVLSTDSKSFVTIQSQTLSNIWVAPNGDSTQAAQITSGWGRYFDLYYAPDGKIVYASDATGSADIYEMALNGSDVRQLTSGMKRNYAPAVSPDNRFIALHSNRSGIFQIWRMDRDGSNPIQLTTGNSESHWPTFTPDGKWMLYQHFESGVAGTVWKVPIDGGIPVKVTDGFALRPSVSPDGKFISYWHNNGQANSPWQLAIVRFEGGPPKFFPVAASVQVQWDTFLRWTADSRSVTYVDQRGGVENLWLQPIDGGSAKQLTDFKDSRLFSFDWTRAGDLVASRGTITKDVVLITDASQ